MEPLQVSVKLELLYFVIQLMLLNSLYFLTQEVDALIKMELIWLQILLLEALLINVKLLVKEQIVLLSVSLTSQMAVLSHKSQSTNAKQNVIQMINALHLSTNLQLVEHAFFSLVQALHQTDSLTQSTPATKRFLMQPNSSLLMKPGTLMYGVTTSWFI